MIITLWILNGLLALAFIAAGTMKIARPRPTLVASGMAWADDFTDPTVKLIGAAEVIGGIGLILPLLTGIAPILTPIAATALAIVMIGAIAVHVRRKESATPSIVLAVLSAASAVLGFLVVL
ncbi:DoxX family protein [Microbacterium sp. B35-04]|uniref:DoxX family protein n=1 Tax=unclassified Microbacterium TaxID=2609290 RepID=UPI0013CFFA9B|nr:MULTISPECIES: DoxX family protein [unclassified Microbacterium]KAF2412693.1 DoxX family protein [Microbacterium sp. B35-04]KAF2418852.1 DoxX family protein [Microbacterium sp. B35-30]